MTYTAEQMAPTVKGISATAANGHVFRFAVADMPVVIATALAAQQDQPAGTYFWGPNLVPGNTLPAGDFPSQCFALVLQIHTTGWSWSQVPSFQDGRYLLFVPQATAALATAGSDTSPDNSGHQVTPDSEGTPGLSDLITGGVEVAGDLVDPLFWRQVYFIVGGWALVIVAVVQVVNRGLITPVRNGLRAVDDVAWDAASLHTNVIQPLAAYRRYRKARKKARATP